MRIALCVKLDVCIEKELRRKRLLTELVFLTQGLIVVIKKGRKYLDDSKRD